MVILSVHFLWRARTRGIFLFSLAHGRWRSRSSQPDQAACPNIRVYGTEHVQFVDVSEVDDSGVQ